MMERTTPSLRFLPACLAATLWFSLPARAEVLRVEVASRGDLLVGKAFGLAGPYEKLIGRIYFAVDPANPANAIITDIGLAPRNASGRVEFSADFFLLKPKDAARGNGSVLLEISNRGGKGMLGFFNRASGSLNPETAEELGDGFLMRHGFTVLWVGWQFDVPQRDGLLRVYAPVATDGGRALSGLVRSDFVVSRREFDHSLADRNHQAYPAADPADPAATLTARESASGQRRTISRAEWRFARREGDRVVEDPTRVYLAACFEPHKIYEVVYRAQNPPVVGVGPAAVRDTLAFLKYGTPEALGIPAGSIRRALGFGISQSGRFLRTYLYYGFNGDEKQRRVLDGVLSHVAGAGRGSFNHRFAQPSRDGHPYLNFFYPTDIFPFTDVEQRDPETGLRDGLLTHAGRPELLPKIFYTNASYEYWGRAASLIHTTVDGTQDAPLLENTRIFFFAGGQHGPAAFPPRRSIGQQPSNPNDYRWSMRSLLLAMDRWAAGGAAPPESRYPKIANRTLVPPDRLAFPKLAGVGQPSGHHRAWRADYGPQFRSAGIATLEPPRLGSSFPILVPQVDEDGNELAGVMMPEVAVPLATFTGWNLFNEQAGPTDVISSMQGSYLPFPRTPADARQAADPRRSIQERYPTREHYLGLVSSAALTMVEQGLLLAEDMAPILKQAARHWDWLMGVRSSEF